MKFSFTVLESSFITSCSIFIPSCIVYDAGSLKKPEFLLEEKQVCETIRNFQQDHNLYIVLLHEVKQILLSESRSLENDLYLAQSCIIL